MDKEHGAHNPEIRYEKSDASPAALARFMFFLVLAVLAVAYIVRGMYFALAAHEAAQQPSPPIMQFEANREPPLPRLEDHPGDDLVAYRAAQMKSITTYAWIDKERGVLRIPVAEAMRVLLEKGLPVAAQGGDAAPAQEPKK